MLDDATCWVGIARRDGAPVGIVTVTTMLFVEWGRLGEIGDLYVLPDYREHGIGNALVDAATAWCLAAGCSAVSVVVTPDGEERHALSHFYGRAGFSTTGRTIMSRDLLTR